MRVYFAGEQARVSRDMQLIGRIYRPHVAVLPIGDHYTMGPREAVELPVASFSASSAACLVTTAPFRFFTGTPEALRELAPEGVEILEPAPGETVEVYIRLCGERWFERPGPQGAGDRRRGRPGRAARGRARARLRGRRRGAPRGPCEPECPSSCARRRADAVRARARAARGRVPSLVPVGSDDAARARPDRS